jgi:hypothetical protein
VANNQNEVACAGRATTTAISVSNVDLGHPDSSSCQAVTFVDPNGQYSLASEFDAGALVCP